MSYFVILQNAVLKQLKMSGSGKLLVFGLKIMMCCEVYFVRICRHNRQRTKKSEFTLKFSLRKMAEKHCMRTFVPKLL